MGCWNGTCGLTNLPISHGDEIYVFPIVENPQDSFCYSTALYSPFVIPFYAEYDDYGSGENCSGAGLDVFIEGMKKNLVEMPIGKNKYHDIAVSKDHFDIDEFFNACHKHRLKIYERNPRSVYFTMVHKYVVDRLIKEWKFDKWRSPVTKVPDGFEANNYYIKNVTYEKLIRLIPDFMQYQIREDGPINKEIANVTCDNETNMIKEKLRATIYDMYFFNRAGRGHILSDIFEHIFGSANRFIIFENTKEKIISEFLNGDKEVAYELLRDCFIWYMVNDYMEHVRKVWLPSMHQGSQSFCDEEYKLLNTVTDDFINIKNTEYY